MQIQIISILMLVVQLNPLLRVNQQENITKQLLATVNIDAIEDYGQKAITNTNVSLIVRNDHFLWFLQ